MRRGVAGVVLAVTMAGGLVACSGDDSEPILQPPLDAVTEAPAYDATLEPSAAVLPLVPAEAEHLEVTDFEQIRLSLGFGDSVTSEASPRVRARFWRAAERRAPLLSTGMLRADEGVLLREYGFTQDDVEWEARFDGPFGAGYVLKFRDDIDMKRVRRASEDGVAGLGGATVVLDAHVAALEAVLDPEESWAAEAERRALVGQRAAATYVSAACLPFEEVFGTEESELAPSPAADVDSLEDLGAFSVSFGAELITARLGALRDDAFARSRLAAELPATDPDFGLGYVNPVADPGGGRIGWSTGDPGLAARLAQEQRLPFAVCAPE